MTATLMFQAASVCTTPLDTSHENLVLFLWHLGLEFIA
jgi:hypothetical protein